MELLNINIKEQEKRKNMDLRYPAKQFLNKN